ncbi:hypothetical protein IWW56_003368 [Coemansia sp. RSA 2131]|nr:hypothetical protein IWW56_003368 [Coemansia sp. RSA 2131]
MTRHMHSMMTATYEDGHEMGTALKVELGFCRQQVHLIGAYVPTASTTNMADYTHTQQIVHGWLTAALDAGDKFILVGNLNKHLFAENRANPTQLGRYLCTSPEVKETTRKLLTWILTDRLSRVIEDNGLLKGLNVGFRPDHRATDLATAVQRIAECAWMASSQLDILMLDVAKAYNSITTPVLSQSLTRVGITGKLQSLIIDLHQN